jgi:hypothetical protein
MSKITIEDLFPEIINLTFLVGAGISKDPPILIQISILLTIMGYAGNLIYYTSS